MNLVVTILTNLQGSYTHIPRSLKRRKEPIKWFDKDELLYVMQFVYGDIFYSISLTSHWYKLISNTSRLSGLIS